MAVGRHPHAQFLADHLLVVEPEPLGEARQLGLVGRLLEQDVDQEGEQAERENKADHAANEGNALEQGDEHRRGDRVEGQQLPLRKGRRHRRLRDIDPERGDQEAKLTRSAQPIPKRNYRHFKRLGALIK